MIEPSGYIDSTAFVFCIRIDASLCTRELSVFARRRCVGTRGSKRHPVGITGQILFGIQKLLVWAVSGLTQLQNAREDQEADGMQRGDLTCKAIAFQHGLQMSKAATAS